MFDRVINTPMYSQSDTNALRANFKNSSCLFHSFSIHKKVELSLPNDEMKFQNWEHQKGFKCFLPQHSFHNRHHEYTVSSWSHRLNIPKHKTSRISLYSHNNNNSCFRYNCEVLVLKFELFAWLRQGLSIKNNDETAFLFTNFIYKKPKIRDFIFSVPLLV